MAHRAVSWGVTVFVVLLGCGFLFWAGRDSAGGEGLHGARAPGGVELDTGAGATEPARAEDVGEVEARLPVAAPEQDSARVSLERGAFLRIVDADGAPAVGLGLQVALARVERRFSIDALYSVEPPDEQGLVDLGGWIEDNEPAAWVVLIAQQPALRLEPCVLAIASLGATPAEAPVVRCIVRPAASVRGLVVDANGAPLPEYPLRLLYWTDAQEPALPAGLELPSIDPLRGSRPVSTRLGEWVTTDPTGRFESRIELPDARVRFVTYEIFSVEADHRVGPDGRGVEVRLEVEAGPVVLLDFEPLEGYAPTDYIATLRRDGDQHPAYINELPSPLDPHAGQRGGGNAAPVHGEPSPRVRIPRLAADDPMPNYFVMESRDRRHFGSVLIAELARYAVEPLRIELATREVLDLRIEWPPASSPGTDLTLLDVNFTRLEALAEDPLAEPEVETFVSRVMLEAETRTWLPGLSPGWFRLVAGAKVQEHEAEARPLVIEQTVSLPRKEPLRIAPRLAPPIALHRIELTVRTASGDPLDGFEGRAALSGFSVQPQGYSERLQWSAGTARTALVGVPAGPVQSQADWGTGWFPTEPQTIAFDAPHGPLEILVRDDVPTERLVLRVLEPAERGELWYRIGAGLPVIHRLERIRADAAIRLPDGRRVFEHSSDRYASSLAIQSVKLTMDGHENIWLGPADIPPADAEGRRVVELVPRRGWSVRVEVVQGADEAARPQPGIALAFDGIETLASDSGGVLVHRADSQPERVAVVTPGWELVQRTSYLGSGTVQGDSGRFTVDDGELTVEVRPSGR